MGALREGMLGLIKKRYAVVGFWAFALLAVGLFVFLIREPDAGRRPKFSNSSVVILKEDGGRISLEVEVARSLEEQKHGLMFVSSIGNGKGMLFPYSAPREIFFWMKNTMIPLDMIFVRADRTICRIVAEARPRDMTPIPSQEPVIAVIEIGGGEAKRLGISVGDKVESPDIGDY